MFIFSNEFDNQIFEELKRNKRVIYRSLSDYFLFGNTMKREILDVIYLDILNEQEQNEETLIKMENYIK